MLKGTWIFGIGGGGEWGLQAVTWNVSHISVGAYLSFASKQCMEAGISLQVLASDGWRGGQQGGHE